MLFEHLHYFIYIKIIALFFIYCIYIYSVACGIIARSAGMFENYKKLCACDGVTIWDERDKPIAGGDRNNKVKL